MRVRSAIVAAVLATGAAVPAAALSAQDESDVEARCWDAGEEYTAEQQVEACTALLASPELAAEDRPYVIAMRGWSYQELGDLDRAIRDYSEKIRLQPTAADGYGWRGDVYLDKGDNEHALADFTWAIHFGPGEQDIAVWYYDRGLVKHNLGDLAGAVRDYDSALERSGPDADTYANRGFVYLDQDDYEKAVEDFSAAIDLAADNAENWNGRCWARAMWGRQLDEAQADCDEALTLDPEMSYAYDSRGLVHLRKNEWAAARADYQAALEIDPEAASGYYGRGIAAIRQGDRAAGESDLATAAGIDATIAESYAGWGIRP